MTIFGLTSTTGTSCIRHIGFHSSTKEILEAASIPQHTTSEHRKVNVYTLNGSLLRTDVPAGDATNELQRGAYIVGNTKVMVQ